MDFKKHIRFASILLGRTFAGFQRDKCMQMAAAISYYVLFSFFPTLILLLFILGLILQNVNLEQRLINAIVLSIPGSQTDQEGILITAIRDVAQIRGGAISIAGLIALVWSSSNVFGVIRDSLNVAYDLEKRRPFVRRKLVDFAMLLGVGLFFVLSVTSTTLLETVRQLSSSWTFLLSISWINILVGETGLFWRLASYLIPFFLTVTAFGAIYWILPAVRIPLRCVIPGAIFAAFLFEVCKIVFVIYLNRFAKYDLIFGSIGAVASFLFWVYLSAVIFLFGAELASEYSKLAKTKERTDTITS